MRVWKQHEWGIDQLRIVDHADPGAPGPGQVAIRMRAAALNYRDLVTVQNSVPFGKLPQIPLSDGAGDVIAVGTGVTRFVVGDAVCPILSMDWLDGPPAAGNRIVVRGSATAPGVLQDILVSDEQAVSAAPPNLSWVEAATLPCAGLTAWRAVVVEGGLRPGDTVLVQGTGGVSLFALQFAKLAGARVIVTSSSDAKLERAKALGADWLINYRDMPQWAPAVLDLTDGIGAQLIVEVGGGGTINQSIRAAAVDGRIVIVGVLGGRSQELLLPDIFSKNLHLRGISAGNRAQFEAMSRYIEAHDLKPVIGSVYGFGDVQDAFREMKAATHFGKICIDFNG